MKITKFQENDQKKKEDMLKAIKEHRLENVKSLWYFVSSTNKATVAGSKG